MGIIFNTRDARRVATAGIKYPSVAGIIFNTRVVCWLVVVVWGRYIVGIIFNTRGGRGEGTAKGVEHPQYCRY